MAHVHMHWYTPFHIICHVMLKKVARNAELVTLTHGPRAKYRATRSQHRHQLINTQLGCMCFSLKTAYSMNIVGSLTLNSQPTTRNWSPKESHLTHVYFLQVMHHSLRELKTWVCQRCTQSVLNKKTPGENTTYTLWKEPFIVGRLKQEGGVRLSSLNTEIPKGIIALPFCEKDSEKGNTCTAWLGSS